MQNRAGVFIALALMFGSGPAGAQAVDQRPVAAPSPPNLWRMVDAQRTTATSPGHFRSTNGELVLDSARREITFDAAHGAATVVPFDGIVALHLEDTGNRRGLVRNRDLFLVVHHAAGQAGGGAETFRMSEGAGLAAVEAIEQRTGRVFDRSEAHASFLGIPVRTTIGTRLSVSDDTGRTTSGTLVSVSTTTLVLRGADGRTRELAASSIRRVRRPYAPGPSALRFALVGSAVGAFNVFLVAGLGGCFEVQEPANCNHLGGATLASAAITAGLFSAVSVTVGAMKYPFNSNYDVYSPPGARPIARHTLVPQPGGGSWGVSMSFRF